MNRFMSRFGRPSAGTSGAILVLTLILALPLGSQPVDARAGGGGSFGSRGTRTFSMPAPTATAPRAQPIQRSDTVSPGFGGAASGAAMNQPRRFGFGSGLAAGLLGAGLFGMMTGNGFFGGIGGLMSLLGLIVQVALIGGLIMLALRFFRGRGAKPAFAGLGSGQSRRDYADGSGFAGAGAAPRATPLTVEARDFTAFERSLSDIQNAYGREDVDMLSRLTTSDMLRVFEAQIEDNRRQGLRNAVSDARLLQGDLSEAWREGGSEFATVAMRFAVRDTMVERSSGRVVSGNPDAPSESTELWTFRRSAGRPWLLSAIQQTR